MVNWKGLKMMERRITLMALICGLLLEPIQAQSVIEVQKLVGVRAIDIYIARLSESGKAKETARVFVKALTQQPDNPNLLYGAMRAVLEAYITNGQYNIFRMSKIRIKYKNSDILFDKEYLSESELKEWEKIIRKSFSLLDKKYNKDLRFILSRIFFIQIFGDPRLRFWEEEIPTKPKGVRIRSNYEEIVKPYWEQVEKLQPENVFLLHEKIVIFYQNLSEKEREQIYLKIFKNIDQLDIDSRRLVLHAMAEKDKKFEDYLKKILLKNPLHPVNLFFVINFRKYLFWFCQETGVKFTGL